MKDDKKNTQNDDNQNANDEPVQDNAKQERQVSEQPVESEASKLAAELETEKTRRLQLFADFQNYQKRVEAEKADWTALSNMSMINDVLEIYDDLQLALNDENLTLDSSREAIKTAQSKMNVLLEAAGVEKIEVNVGDEFDKDFMEAVTAVPSGEENKNKVIAVITSAIKLKSREGIFKPAKVVVGK